MQLLLITNVFPNPCQPTKGVFNLRLAAALAREHRVRVVCPVAWVDEWRAGHGWNGPPGGRRAVLDGVEVHYPRFYYPPKVLRTLYGSFFWASTAPTIRRLLAEERSDVVLGYWAHPDGEAAVRAARLAGVPAVVMLGGSDTLLLTKEPARRRCVVEVLQRANAVVTVGADLAAKVHELGIGSEKVHVVPRGIDPDLFALGDAKEARQRLGIPSDGNVLLWVGRMVDVKGLDVLLDACVGLRARGQDCRLYLVGDGPLKGTLERDVVAKGLGDQITFVGALPPERLGDWYRAADLFVLPSRSEGIPNVLRESLGCGTPFVASRVGGIPEIAGGPVNRLVPPGDPEALAEGIAAALHERAFAGPLHFPSGTWEESARRLVRVVEPLVGARSVSEGQSSLTLRAPMPPANREAERPHRGRVGRVRQLLKRALSLLVPRRRFLVHGSATTPAVCLTFDDGPHPEHTPRLLDVLKEHDVRATFFVVGEQAELHPDLVRRMAEEGHAVGNHTFHHSTPESTPARELLAEVERTDRLLSDLIGGRSFPFRPPQGKLTAAKLWRLWRTGRSVVLWNVDPKDYAAGSTTEVRAWFGRRPLRAGDVVLLHDRVPHAAGVLPELVAAARGQGLSFQTVPEWLR